MSSSGLTLTAFFSAGGICLDEGVNLVNSGQTWPGVGLAAVGVAVIGFGVYLYEKGQIPMIVKKVKQALAAATA